MICKQIFLNNVTHKLSLSLFVCTQLKGFKYDNLLLISLLNINPLFVHR